MIPHRPPMSCTAKRKFHVLHLGAGVQSTTIYLMSLDGELINDHGEPVVFDAAVFADTRDEENETYEHLDWLKTQGGAPIVTVSAGSLSESLKKGTRTSGGTRFASIPAFTKSPAGRGITKRQCTNEFKVRPIERWVRRELVGLKPKQRIPKDVSITSYFGFSLDEPGRAVRTRRRFTNPLWQPDFPLFWESICMTRQGCKSYLDSRVPHEVVGSACVYCPFKSQRMWRRLRDKPDPTDWNKSVDVDHSLRDHLSICNTGMDWPMYVHQSCKPLDEAYLEDDQGDLFDMDCDGGCGL